MSGIRRSAMRPKIAKHLRTQSSKTFTNRTKEERDREHALTDAWAERERAKEPEREQAAREERWKREQDAAVARRERERALVGGS